MKQERLIRYNLPYTAVKSYIGYVKEMKKYDNSFIEKKGGAFSEVKHKSINEETYVLIIGESFSKFHSSLYGYYRKTNVLLEKIHNELFIYNDVISPHANTLKSIPKILTLGNYENPDFIFKGSIIQLFNKAGFETYWLSNHEPIGINETGITKITKAADKHFFTNIEMPLAPLDEVLLDYLTEILSIDKKKKFIVIHLLGSHIYYADRYPENFNKFKDTPKTSFHNEKAYKEINEYDNSILYNDFIVWQIINYVKKTQTKSFIVYLSDHGEDVYKTSNMAYHEEGWKSKFVYQIPFIVWCSDTLLKQRKNLVFDTTRVYMTDDLIYSIADLADINFAQFDPERSIFNKKFKSRKRIILDSIDFDKKELIEKPNL